MTDSLLIYFLFTAFIAQLLDVHTCIEEAGQFLSQHLVLPHG